MLNRIYGWAAKLRQKLSEKGQGMVEYAMILAAVAIIAVIAIWGVPGTKDEQGQTTGAQSGLKDTITSAFGNAQKAVEKGNTATTDELNKRP